MKERSNRSALTIYGIALAVVSAIVGLLWWQKVPTTQRVTDIEYVQPQPGTDPPRETTGEGGTTGGPVVGTVTTVTPANVTPANPYGPQGPFGPGGPGGPKGPLGPAGPSGNTPPE